MQLRLMRFMPLAAGIVLTACGSAGTTPAVTSAPAAGAQSCTPQGAHAVCIDPAFKYESDSLTVAKGTTVTFTNSSTSAHTATTDPSAGSPASFDTGTLEVGQSHTVTFTTSGTYRYECAIHNFMKGTVVVTP